MPWYAAIVQAVVEFAIKASGYVAAFFAGETRQQAKDQGKVIDAATARAEAEDENRRLDDAALRDKLRAGR